MAHFHLADGWRLGEDGRLQWILQRKRGERWRDRAGAARRRAFWTLPYLTTGSPLQTTSYLR